MGDRTPWLSTLCGGASFRRDRIQESTPWPLGELACGAAEQRLHSNVGPRAYVSFVTQERLSDRWAGRGCLVLLETVQRLDAGELVVDAVELVDQLGFDQPSIAQALDALGRADYLDVGIKRMLSGDIHAIATGITERGRRAGGLWLSGQTADTLVDALRQAEGLASDPDEETLIRRSAGAVGSISRDGMVDVMTAVVARQSGLG